MRPAYPDTSDTASFRAIGAELGRSAGWMSSAAPRRISDRPSNHASRAPPLPNRMLIVPCFRPDRRAARLAPAAMTTAKPSGSCCQSLQNCRPARIVLHACETIFRPSYWLVVCAAPMSFLFRAAARSAERAACCCWRPCPPVLCAGAVFISSRASGRGQTMRMNRTGDGRRWRSALLLRAQRAAAQRCHGSPLGKHPPRSRRHGLRIERANRGVPASLNGDTTVANEVAALGAPIPTNDWRIRALLQTIAPPATDLVGQADRWRSAISGVADRTLRHDNLADFRRIASRVERSPKNHLRAGRAACAQSRRAGRCRRQH